MANRVAATYSGSGSSQTNHTITFTAPGIGARLILLVSSYYDIPAAPTGWTQDFAATGFNYVYAFSKVATGTETSVTLTVPSADTKVHAVLHERDDCAAVKFTASGTSTTTSVSATATVPSGISVGRAFVAINAPNGTTGTLTYTQGQAQNHSVAASLSNSYFANGALPAAGSRTFTASGSVLSGSNSTALLVVGYGTTDTTAPTTPPNLRTTAVTGTQIDVAWDAATDNIGVTGYGVYKDGVKQGADQAGLTKSLTGLTTGQTYTIEVDAVDAAGNRSTKTQITVATDTTPPTVPGNLRTTAISYTSISITWDASSDALTGVTGYGVYKDGVKQGADQAGLTKSLTGLTPGQTYVVEVDAKDGAGNRSVKAQINVQTTPDIQPPTTPGGLHTTAVTPYGATLAWSASTDDVAVAGYGVYVGGVKQGTDQPGLSAVLSGLQAATSHLVEVDAADPSGNRSARTQITVVTPEDLPPSTPAGLHVTYASYVTVTVAWDAATDDVAVTGYDVVFDGESFTVNQPDREVSFTGLTEGTQHVVRVRAVDSRGQRSLVPAELVVSTLDDTPPTAPTVTTQAGEDSISVAWGTSVDDFGVDHFEVHVDGQVVHTTPGLDYTVDGPVMRRHRVTGLVPGADYNVRVAAVDAVGQLSADNTVTVTTQHLPYLPIASPVYRIGEWAANAHDEHGVDWVVEKPDGWASTPPVRPKSASLGGTDGAVVGAGQYGARMVTLEGIAIAPSRMAMLAAKQRLLGAVHPSQFALLQVADILRTRQARVRLVGQVEITDETDHGFTWKLRLRAADPRRYATAPTVATAILDVVPGQASLTLTLAGNYPTIPARLRLYGPIKDFTIAHEESGTVMRAMPGTTIPADPGYSLGLDLATRQVWAYVPPEVWPQPRPGRGALAHLPAWFQLLPGTNTITVAGQPVAGQIGEPRLVVEAFDAWR